MSEQEITKFSERRTFILTTTIFLPLVMITIIGAFGFVAWISQSFIS